MNKENIKAIVAAGGEVTYKKLYIGDIFNFTERRSKKYRYQLESRYGDYESPYNSSNLYEDLDTAVDRFMLIYNMVQNGELK